jgi:hypothetical protein
MRPVYHVASALVAEAQFEALGKQLDRTHTAASLRSLAESLTVLRRGLAPKLAPDPHSTPAHPRRCPSLILTLSVGVLALAGNRRLPWIGLGPVRRLRPHPICPHAHATPPSGATPLTTCRGMSSHHLHFAACALSRGTAIADWCPSVVLRGAVRTKEASRGRGRRSDQADA